MKLNKELTNPKLYFNRELSLLDFNARVLSLSTDNSIPLLERLRFLFIVSSNLDEFFEIRVAGLKEKVMLGVSKPSADGATPSQALQAISEKAHPLVENIYQIYNRQLLPALKQENIHFITAKEWNNDISNWTEHLFAHEILPILSPIGLDLTHPFPRLVNKSLNFIVTLTGPDVFHRDSGLAIVHAPRALPRAFKLPDELAPSGDCFVLLTEIISRFTNELFPGMTVTGCYPFRLTRNSDVDIEDDASEDLALALKKQLLKRPYGDVARLEISAECPETISDFLLQKHGLTTLDLYHCQGPVNLNRYMAVLDLLERDDLRYPHFTPGLPEILQEHEDLFATLRQQDILVHHPYQSFNVVLQFVQQASSDPNVIAIKQTLYRTHPRSRMVKALIHAARTGKEVTAIIELRARFDEASNIELANHLQQAGALVVYGVVSYKTHAKMTLVVRKENKRIVRYAHLGTGNYHEDTTRLYTDFGLLTHNKSMTHDVQKVFQLLTGMGKAMRLSKLLYSPVNLAKQLLHLIEQECQFAKTPQGGRIILKLNGLSDPKIIRALYGASQAGVKIQLLVRGICCLRPGIKGVSENIKVYSVLGRFLEHSRIYWFQGGGEEKIYCSSADWMERNLYHRVEVCFPIEDPQLAKRVKKEGLMTYLNDSAQTWMLTAKGEYKKVKPRKDKKVPAQTALLELLAQKPFKTP